MKRTAFLSIMTVLASCTAEEAFLEPREPDRLTFSATLSPVSATRSTATELSATTSGGKTITVEAFLRPMSADGFPEAEAATKGTPVSGMYDGFSYRSDEGWSGRATPSGDDLYEVGDLQYFNLPKDAGNRFFCWAPDGGAGLSWTDGGLLHYAAPDDITLQPDLVTAISPEMGRLDKGPTPLVFSHALAGLQIVPGTVFPNCTVHSVTLSGVVAEGFLDPWTGTWELADRTADYTILSEDKTGVTAESGYAGTECTLMLVPQVLPAGAVITIRLTFSGVDFTYTIPLEGLELKAGQILTLGTGCRSMYLFEGTASGNFSVYYFKGVVSGTTIYKICDVPVNEDGTFSVLVPELTNARHSYSFARNAQLKTVTRLPDILATRTTFQRMFQGCSGLTGIYCKIPSGKVTTWSWAFYNCSSLTDLPDELDTKPCTDFSSMFFGCRRLRSVPRMDTGSGTAFTSMFNGCASLTTAPDLVLTKGTDFSSMFNGCSSLQELQAYEMPKGKDFSSFCKGCTSLREIPALVTSAGTNFNAAFSNCTSLQEVYPIDTGRGTNFTAMFSGCSSLRGIPLLNTAAGTVFREMFQNCVLLEGLPLLDTRRGTTFYATFSGCKALTACPELDTSSATNMHAMFFSCTSLTETWPYRTEKVSNFSEMFSGCSRLVRVDGFDTSSGTDFDRMFQSCTSLVEIPAFNFVKASTHHYMFAGCSRLASVPDWNWSAMKSCYHMFEGCTALQEIGTDITTSSCTNFENMFSGCTSLRRVASLDVSSMISGSSIFLGCSALVESPALNAPNATSVSQIFDGCQKLSLVRDISFPQATSWYAFFRNCYALTSLPSIDLSGATSLTECFECYYGRGALRNLPAIEASSLTAATNVLNGQQRLTDFGGFRGIGISFDVSDCTALSRESLLNILDGLAQTEVPRTVTLGSENKGKLTDGELQSAIDKGWTVL